MKTGDGEPRTAVNGVIGGAPFLTYIRDRHDKRKEENRTSFLSHVGLSKKNKTDKKSQIISPSPLHSLPPDKETGEMPD